MKMELRVKIYSQVFHWMSSGYRGRKNFIPVYQIVGPPGERYNFGFVNFEFHIVRCTPTTYWDNVRLQEITVFRRSDSKVNFNVICKYRYLKCLIESHKSCIQTLKRRGPRTDHSGSPDNTSNGEEVASSIRPCNCLFVTVYITVRKSKGTKFVKKQGMGYEVKSRG
jgi:hypothetical protein